MACIILLMGVLVAAVSSQVGWYGITDSFQGTTSSSHYQTGVTYSLFSPCDVASMQVYLFCGEASASTLGTLYQLTGTLVVLGLAIAFAAMVFGFVLILAPRSRSRLSPMMPFILTVVAATLILAAPLVLALAQPAAYGATVGSENGFTCPNNGGGPNTTFFGGCSVPDGTIGTYNFSWGPSVGWYLALVAFALFLVGALQLRRFGRSMISLEDYDQWGSGAPVAGGQADTYDSYRVMKEGDSLVPPSPPSAYPPPPSRP
jgi:hypothetical protein